MMNWLAASLLYALLQVTHNADPCADGEHDIVANDFWRSTGFKRVPPSGIYNCDNTISVASWTRFTSPAGGDMPITCPELERCGTYFPVWLQGTLPQPNEGIVSRQACIRGMQTCCDTTVTIQIKNCGRFNIYKLAQVPLCPAGFCFGKYVKCPDGTSSLTGFTGENDPNCNTNFPPMTTKPDLIFGDDGNQIVFKCVPNIDEEKVGFLIKWYFGNKLVHEEDTKVIPAKLLEKDWVGKASLGNMVKCGVRPYYHNEGVPGLEVFSEEQFAGIEVITPGPVELIQGGEAKKIQVKSTVAIIPRIGTVQTIPLQLYALFPKYKTPNPVCKNTDDNKVALKETKCDVHLRVLKTVYNIEVAATEEVEFGDAEYYMQVRFGIRNAQKSYPAWDGYTLPPVAVQVVKSTKKIKMGTCKSECDPHMTTFDQRKYECQHPGEFVLYRHKKLPVQVNVFHALCNRNYAYCPCGVVVKAGANVFFLYKCPIYRGGRRISRPLQKFGRGCDEKEHLTIDQLNDGHTFNVNLPTGTVVKINYFYYVDDYYMNVYVIPGPLDPFNTEGLCGSFDEMASNDIQAIASMGTEEDRLRRPNKDPVDGNNPSEVCKAWRVPPNSGSSLYQNPNANIPYYVNFCKCTAPENPLDRPSVQCSYSKVVLCQDKLHDVTDILFNAWRANKCEVTRQKRATEEEPTIDEENEELIPFDYDTDESVPVPSWDSCPDWDYNKALEFCTQKVANSKSSQSCIQTVPDIDSDGPIQNCIEDIKIGCTTDWSDVTNDAIVTDCQAQVERNTSLWIADNSTGELNVRIPDAVQNDVCPSDCSGHGLCKNGTCYCDLGFAGATCSDDVNAAPILYPLQNNGLCDTRNRACLKTIVQGDTFINSENLTCKVVHHEITEDGPQAPDSIKYFKAIFRSFQDIFCPFASSRNRRSVDRSAALVLAHGYIISVTNNGLNYSDNLEAHVYDSKCTTCNTTTGRCSQKSGTCYIGGLCYDNGEVKDGTPCLVCNPNNTVVNWDLKDGTCYIDGVCYRRGDLHNTSDCFICLPELDNSTWSQNKNKSQCTAEKPSEENWHYYVIGGVLGGVMLIIFVVAIIFLKRRRAGKRKEFKQVRTRPEMELEEHVDSPEEPL